MIGEQWLVLTIAASPLIAWLLIEAFDWVVGVVVLDAPDALDVDQAGGVR